MFSNNPARKSSTECRKGFAQCARMLKSIWLFLKKNSHIDIMDTSKAVFTTLPKNFRRRVKVFGSFLNKNSTYTIFSTKYFLSKFSCGNVHFSFGKPAGSLLAKTEKIRSKNENYEKYTFFQKKTSLKWSSGHEQYCFFLSESFCSLSKNDNLIFFPRNSPLNVSIETWNAVFSHLHKKSCRKAKIFSGQVPKKYRKRKKRFSKIIFRQNVPMDT